MHTEGGADQFDDTTTLPADPDESKSATFVPGMVVLMNRTTFLKNRLLRVPALSWEKRSLQTHKLRNAAWSSFDASWISTSFTNADLLARSFDNGATWATEAPGAAGLNLETVAVDLAGNIVTCGVGGDSIYEYNQSSGGWHTHAASLIGSVNGSVVVFEPVNGVWFAVCNDSFALEERVAVSRDRIVWADQAANLPALWSAAGTLNSIAAHAGVGNGRVVVARFFGGQARVTSADASAPTVWAASSIIAPVMTTPAGISDPVYIPSKNRWLITIFGSNIGLAASEIWSSDDGGLSFHLLAPLGGITNALQVLQLAVLDRLVLGIASASGFCVCGRIVYSEDNGVSWYLGPFIAGDTSTTASTLWSGDGGCLCLDLGGINDGSRSSIRMGKANSALVTT